MNKQAFTIKWNSGREETCQGYTVGEFAVHKCANEYADFPYEVSHISTGYAVGFAHRITEAYKAAKALSSIDGWTENREENTEKLKDQILDLFDDIEIYDWQWWYQRPILFAERFKGKLKTFVVGTERIECPNCGKVQGANVTYTEADPHYTYVHTCERCDYIIIESEWDVSCE